MKKADLKKLIKPLVKECIHEVLIEEGVLSNVVSEVAKGMQTNVVVESNKQDEQLFNEDLQCSSSLERVSWQSRKNDKTLYQKM